MPNTALSSAEGLADRERHVLRTDGGALPHAQAIETSFLPQIGGLAASDSLRVSARLPCVHASVGRARRVVLRVLAAWDMGDLACCGEVIISELMTNVVTHTATPLAEITIELQPDNSVRLGVSDRSCSAPYLQAVTADAESGRGIRLVASMSQRWGYDIHSWGKVTWAVIALEGTAS
ncbi:ATP-binding protein [Streptomyces sp. NPDC020330]|uniref:ATP-binding protein n=1 Tax=unclassified Streptomyces TaxID=2593676 RepID=UPI0037BA4C63